MSMQEFEVKYSSNEVNEAFDMVARFLRNNLDDGAYKEFLEALDIIYNYKKD